jgi:hypothetical protein
MRFVKLKKLTEASALGPSQIKVRATPLTKAFADTSLQCYRIAGASTNHDRFRGPKARRLTFWREGPDRPAGRRRSGCSTTRGYSTLIVPSADDRTDFTWLHRGRNSIAISRYLQKAFASCICRGVRHSASKSRGEATMTQMHFALYVATFSRFAL